MGVVCLLRYGGVSLSLPIYNYSGVIIYTSLHIFIYEQQPCSYDGASGTRRLQSRKPVPW